MTSDAFGGPPLAVPIGPDGQRGYRHPETGELVPSVTTILRVIDKPALVGWAARETAGAAWDQRFALARIDDRDAAVDLLKNARFRTGRRAMLKGSTIHAVAEALSTDAPLPDYGEDEAPYVDAFVSFVSTFAPRFELVEGTVFSDTCDYAGTFDFLARIDGFLVLGDHKTGKGIYPEVALQLAALRYADRVWNRETGELTPMPKVDGCVAVHLQAGDFRVVEVKADEDAFAAFVAARELWPWAREDGGQTRAIGPSMTPTRLRRALEEVPA